MGALAKTETDTVGNAARAVLASAGGDIAKATKLMIDKVRSDRSLKMAILDPLLEYACHQAISQVHRHSRDRVWNPPQPNDNASPAERAAAMARANLMLFPLPSGKLLQDAKRSEVASAADFYGKQASDMSHKARWLSLIGQSLPEDKSVKEALSVDRLQELKEEASNG